MDKVGIKVIASFPDLNALGREKHHGGLVQTEQPCSTGRIINQALAFKVLSAVTLLLLVIAVRPLFSGRAEKPAESPAMAATPTPWQPAANAAAGTMVAQMPAARPVTVVPAAPQEAAAPVVVPSPAKTTAPPSANPPADGELASKWPDPGRAINPQAGYGDAPRATANQPMTVRPAEYQADARTGNRPGLIGAPPVPNSNPSVPGNRYDRTRPSAY
ncbi:MAG: hypothetical protein LLG00_00230 [Planctomycetaceae bacterium]|nr:hypothetical protein [Planctomycetaceae bacterium]